MKKILDDKAINRSLTRMAHEILEGNEGVSGLVLVGIKTRGEYLAERLAKLIDEFENVDVPCVAMDISYWRDDERKNTSEIPPLGADLSGKVVIIVDDVLYSGRTIRACMEGIMYYGRAKAVHLAVLVDRGHRELPIRPDYVGKNIPTSYNEAVKVKIVEVDGVDEVIID